MKDIPRKPLLLVFVDGLGLAPVDSSNPLSELSLPNLEELIGGRLLRGVSELSRSRRILVKEIDACLGVEGLPQSATGQATLFTGQNASKLLGRHVPALPGAKLRELIERHSIFRVLQGEGRRCAFANAFTERFFEYLEKPRRRQRPSASLSAALAGEVALRTTEAMLAGNALSHDITREFYGVPLPQLRKRAKVSTDATKATVSGSTEVELVTAGTAGGHLHSIALRHDFTLFETFVTDLAGHGRYVIDARAALDRIDGLVGGLRLAGCERRTNEPDLTVLITSDHGNVEDLRTRMHTRNPVPLIAWGPGASAFEQVESLVDVVPAALSWLGRDRGEK